MVDTGHPLLVVAASARTLARSAVRADRNVTAIDGFGDLDTRRSAHRYRYVALGPQGFDRTTLIQTLNRHPGHTLVYGGGLEWTPDLLVGLRNDIEVAGNAPEVLQTLTDAERLFAELTRLVIPYPEVRHSPPNDDGAWLSKRAAACGGGHVRWWQAGEPHDAGRYFQRYAAGTPYSVVFLANRHAFRVVGWNTLLGPDERLGFRYRGAINRADALDARARIEVHGWIHRLVMTLGLVGLNGIDFVLTTQGPLLIDLNARPPATMSLYDPEYPHGLVQAHIEAGWGILPTTPQTHPVRAHEVVPAPRRLTIPAGFCWPDWCADIPAAGTRVPESAPVCSVLARAAAHYLRRLLAERKARVVADLMRTETASQALAS
ncbi:MAG: ATP-grasp domain-containing protein [Gammaproteobacteria bacterium]|nr:ATP-grasp domain-containing protein [Gammaproteobacteria bacterium]